METKTPTVHPLSPETLANFYGSETFTRHWMGKMVMTEGIVHVTENGAAWLLDIVGSVQGPALEKKTEGFQHWTVQSNEAGGFLVTCDDGNGNIAYRQEGEYTDFPFGLFTGRKFSFYVELGSLDGVNPEWIALLPSER